MNKMTQGMVCLVFATCALVAGSAALAIDNGNNSMVDKADSYDLQGFHKDTSEATWKSDKKDKPVATYREEEGATPATGTANSETEHETSLDAVKTPQANRSQPAYEAGQSLKVRESYKLSNDPTLKNVPTLFEAIESLEKQLNGYCPDGWIKTKEWRKPEAEHLYIYYQASCL